MRADLYLFSHQYVKSRQRAKDLILESNVQIDGKTILKPAEEIDGENHRVEIFDSLLYVGRGGKKLDAALKVFSPEIQGITALDIGASTGGFTDCLLQNGAGKVIAVDSGEGQLDQKLQADKRVLSLEKTNARTLEPSMIGGPVDLIVMDVSFISQTLILPQFPNLLKENGKAITLIKPQFELGKSKLGKNGIVKDKALHQEAVIKVYEAAKAVGLSPLGLIESPIVGGDGNVEFLMYFQKESTEKQLTKAEIINILKKK